MANPQAETGYIIWPRAHISRASPGRPPDDLRFPRKPQIRPISSPARKNLVLSEQAPRKTVLFSHRFANALLNKGLLKGLRKAVFTGD